MLLRVCARFVVHLGGWTVSKRDVSRHAIHDSALYPVSTEIDGATLCGGAQKVEEMQVVRENDDLPIL